MYIESVSLNSHLCIFDRLELSSYKARKAEYPSLLYIKRMHRYWIKWSLLYLHHTDQMEGVLQDRMYAYMFQRMNAVCMHRCAILTVSYL